jgi:hypothetical protein
MSERSLYLRDEADKCRLHAIAMTDAYVQAELRRLAAEYIERAAEIERAKAEAAPPAAEPAAAGRRPPSLWSVTGRPHVKPDG